MKKNSIFLIEVVNLTLQKEEFINLKELSATLGLSAENIRRKSKTKFNDLILVIAGVKHVPFTSLSKIKERIGYNDSYNPMEYFSTAEAANYMLEKGIKEIGLKKAAVKTTTLQRLCTEGFFQKSINHLEKHYIEKNELEVIIKQEEALKTFKNQTQLCKKLNLCPKKINKLIKSNNLDHFFLEVRGLKCISRSSLSEFKERIGYYANFDSKDYYTISEAVQNLKENGITYFKGREIVYTLMHELIQKGELAYILHLGKYYLHEKEVKKLRDLLLMDNSVPPHLIEKDYISFYKLSQLFGVSDSTPHFWRKEGKINEFILHKSQYFIARSSIQKLKDRILYNDEYINNKDKYVSIEEAFEELIKNGIDIAIPSTVRRWCEKDVIESLKHLSHYYISRKELDRVIDSYTKTITVGEAAKLFSVSSINIKDYIKKDLLIGFKRDTDKNWVVKKDSLNELWDFKQNCMSAKEVTKLAGFKGSQVVLNAMRNGLFPNHKKIGSIYYFHKDDVEEYLKKVSEVPEEFTNEIAIEQFYVFLKQLNLPPYLVNTMKLFKEFGFNQINKSKGRSTSKRAMYNQLTKTANLIFSYLTEEIYNISSDEIEDYIEDSNITQYQKYYFVRFLNYTYAQKNIIPEKTYSYSKDTTQWKTEGLYNDKEIYSPEKWDLYNKYVQDIYTHIPQAIKNRNYANMWVYTIMHLTNVWRSSDVVYLLPEIDLKSIDVSSFDWFKSNILSTEHCQKIINQLHSKLEYSRANKNNTELRFIVFQDIIQCLATSVVISELHRRQVKRFTIPEKKLLLGSLVIGLKDRKVTVKDSHLKFFANRPELRNFSSLVMNRTTSTYLFYNIIEENGDDSDLAIFAVKQARSHEVLDSSATYVQLINKDGSINRVSLNLFNRGLFGFIYNYLVITASSYGKNAAQTLEERTKTIGSLRNDLTLIEAENWSSFISNILEKRKALVLELAKKPQEELLDLICKLYRKQMPARTKYGQCLTYPSCKNPNYKNCFKCEYLIPEDFILIEAVNELRRLVKSVSSTKFEAVRVRDSRFIAHLFLILNEAVKVLGKEHVNAFIPPNEISTIKNEIRGYFQLKPVENIKV